MTAEKLVTLLRVKGWTLATAESCTGGMVAAAITDIVGASDVFDRGYVTYSNKAKSEMIGVDDALIEDHGAVSEAVARAMAEGALNASGTDIALAITGIAGPGGGSDTKPVGLVHFACATQAGTQHICMRFGNLGRSAIRRAAVTVSLQLVADCL